MVASVITRVPLLNKPEYDQIGPIMIQSSLWKVKTIRDEFTTRDAMTFPLDGIGVGIEYFQGSVKHSATVNSQGGRILCSYCTTSGKAVAWCTHIRFLAMNHLDTTLYDPEKGDEGQGFMIPIVPTEGIFMPVLLRSDETRAGYTDVVLALSERENETLTDVPIGQVFSDFGMIELRSIVVDFLEGWLSNSRYFMGRTDDSSDFANRFYLATTGKTLAFTRAGSAASADAPVF